MDSDEEGVEQPVIPYEDVEHMRVLPDDMFTRKARAFPITRKFDSDDEEGNPLPPGAPGKETLTIDMSKAANVRVIARRPVLQGSIEPRFVPALHMSRYTLTKALEFDYLPDDAARHCVQSLLLNVRVNPDRLMPGRDVLGVVSYDDQTDVATVTSCVPDANVARALLTSPQVVFANSDVRYNVNDPDDPCTHSKQTYPWYSSPEFRYYVINNFGHLLYKMGDDRDDPLMSYFSGGMRRTGFVGELMGAVVGKPQQKRFSDGTERYIRSPLRCMCLYLAYLRLAPIPDAPRYPRRSGQGANTNVHPALYKYDMFPNTMVSMIRRTDAYRAVVSKLALINYFADKAAEEIQPIMVTVTGRANRPSVNTLRKRVLDQLIKIHRSLVKDYTGALLDDVPLEGEGEDSDDSVLMDTKAVAVMTQLTDEERQTVLNALMGKFEHADDVRDKQITKRQLDAKRAEEEEYKARKAKTEALLVELGDKTRAEYERQQPKRVREPEVIDREEEEGSLSIRQAMVPGATVLTPAGPVVLPSPVHPQTVVRRWGPNMPRNPEEGRRLQRDPDPSRPDR